MADRTTLASVAISSSYQQLLFVADTTGVPGTGASPADSLIYSSGGKKAAFKIGFDQCSIPSGSHNFDVGSHNGTYGLKLGGTLVTASAAELNYNDVAAIGTTAASKSMVTDANGAIQFPDSSATTHRLDFGDSSDMVMYHDGSNAYIRNKTGALKIATESSGIAVTIGHTTSETTVADNLNTTGLIRVNDTTEATSATDGSLQTDGGLSVVKSAVIGDDLDLLSDSAILNMGAGKDFTITHDGTTGATLAGTPISINSTGDLTLDSSTDIILDADGADIIFKDGGTAIGKISNSSSDLVIENEVDAKDIIFKQYDGSEVCRMADDRRLYFFDKGGEYISSDGSDLTIAAGTAVNITAGVLDLSNDTKDVTLNSAVDAINFDSNTLSIDASNNRVGIGTAAPDSALHVSGTSTFTGNISLKGYDANTSYGIEIYDTGGQEWTMQYDGGLGDGGLHFTEVGEEVPRLFLEDGGNIGIGTTSPDTLLEVLGSFAANGPSSTFVTMASGDTSPDVSTGNIFKSHTDGVTIDQFDGGICGQIITIISGGATVYDVTSSELKGGTTNITTAAGDVTMWVCESATVWHLLSWMDLSIDLSSGGF